MKFSDKIMITGSTGLVGNALCKILLEAGYVNVFAVNRTHCDLCDYKKTVTFIKYNKPDYIFHLAAQVYGIMGNIQNKGKSYLYNSLINMGVVEGARQARVKKIVCMGSGCVYPYPSPGLPLTESMVWQGKPHDSENSYAHAKRGMLAHLEAYSEEYGMDFAFVISGNLYGPHDKFDPDWGHVIPSLVSKFYAAARRGEAVTVWGDGSARRDFTYSEDAARALLAIMLNLSGPVNMGSGKVYSIRRIVETLAAVCSMEGRVIWDASKPNGQDYRAYDMTKLQSTGFQPRIDLRTGLTITFDWYSAHIDVARR
jgi:GDP-L-fucose synthase